MLSKNVEDAKFDLAHQQQNGVALIDQAANDIIQIRGSSQKSIVSIKSSGNMESKNRQTSSDEIAVIENPAGASPSTAETSRNKSTIIDLSMSTASVLDSKKTAAQAEVTLVNPSAGASSKKSESRAHAQSKNREPKVQPQKKNMPALRKRGAAALHKQHSQPLSGELGAVKPSSKRQKRCSNNGYMNSQVSKQEQKMIYQALKNSLVESENINNKLHEIDEMPVFRPTEEEFKSPMDYVEKLYYTHKVHQYGCVKIVPPASFKPELSFDIQSDRRLPTRYQVLQKLAQGQPFHQNRVGHTFEDFQRIAKAREEEDEHIDWSNDQEIYEHIERRYWDIVDNQVGDEIKVEYAADLDANKYGSGFGRRDHQLNSKGRKNSCEDHSWNLNNFQSQRNSMFQFKTMKDMSGINVPWVYVGMKYSTFCWHYEDLMLPSINYSHWGKPKLWYGVPECHREKFDRVVKEKCSLLFKKDPNILYDVTTMISPAYLQTHGVRMFKTLQRPGEFVLTYPGSYHGGFSTGLNIGEAVNFATKTWLTYGLKCQQIYRASRERIPVFPIEWLLLENIRSFKNTTLSLPEVKIIRDNFTNLVNEELRSRKKFEDKIQKNLINKKVQDPKKSMQEQIQYIANRETVEEDEFQCKLCTDLCYFSMIKCKVHTLRPDARVEEEPKDSSETPEGPADQQIGNSKESSKQTSSGGTEDMDGKSSAEAKEDVKTTSTEQQKEKQKKQQSIINESKYQKRQNKLQASEIQEQFCIHHQDFCKCPIENYILYYRFSSEELIELREQINRYYISQEKNSQIENKESMDGH